jgi:hypothetical protein
MLVESYGFAERNQPLAIAYTKGKQSKSQAPKKLRLSDHTMLG